MLQTRETLNSLQIENKWLQSVLTEKNQEIERLKWELKYATSLLVQQMVPLDSMPQQPAPPATQHSFKRAAGLRVVQQAAGPRVVQQAVGPRVVQQAVGPRVVQSAAGHMSAHSVAWKPATGPGPSPMLLPLQPIPMHLPSAMPPHNYKSIKVQQQQQHASPAEENDQMLDIADIAFESFFPHPGLANGTLVERLAHSSGAGTGTGDGTGTGGGTGSEWELQRCDTLIGLRVSTDSAYHSPTHSECQSPTHPRVSTDSECQSPTHSECQSPTHSEWNVAVQNKWERPDDEHELSLWVHNYPADEISTSTAAECKIPVGVEHQDLVSHHRVAGLFGCLSCYSLVVFQLASLPLLYSVPTLLGLIVAVCFCLSRLDKNDWFALGGLGTASPGCRKVEDARAELDKQSWTRSNRALCHTKQSIWAHSLPELYQRRGSWPPSKSDPSWPLSKSDPSGPPESEAHRVCVGLWHSMMQRQHSAQRHTPSFHLRLKEHENTQETSTWRPTLDMISSKTRGKGEALQ